MNFGEAVNSALIKKYATFKGRACRAEWRQFLLFSVLVTIVVTSAISFFTFGSVDWEYVATLNEGQAAEYVLDSDFGKAVSAASVVLSLALFLPSFAVTVRRVQDLDGSYFWEGNPRYAQANQTDHDKFYRNAVGVDSNGASVSDPKDVSTYAHMFGCWETLHIIKKGMEESGYSGIKGTEKCPVDTTT